MKSVVSSVAALVMAVAPLTAMASSTGSSTSSGGAAAHKATATATTTTSGVKRASTKKSESAEAADSQQKVESETKSAVRTTMEGAAAFECVLQARKDHAKENAKDKEELKPVAHRSHGSTADFVLATGTGHDHREPKGEKSVRVESVSLVTKTSSSKSTHSSRASKHVEPKAAEMPRLPNPNAPKASRAGAEKGAPKATEKKDAESSSDSDGQPERDAVNDDRVALPQTNQKVALRSRAREIQRVDAKHVTCTKDPVAIFRGPEVDTFALTTCDGALAPLAIERLSVSIRPASAPRPTAPVAELAKNASVELAKGIHRVDEGLAHRLQAVADRFGQPGVPVKMSIVSGFRPTSVGSQHATGRAVDFRVEGTKNEDVITFCKTLADTGCGFYPNSSFVHIDVRSRNSGRVAWIDASRPGEPPRYVSIWPPESDLSESVSAEPKSALEPAAATQSGESAEPHEMPANDESPSEKP